MGLQRHKLARGLGDFVPISINFSELEKVNNSSYHEESEIEFEPSDNGVAEDKIMDELLFEEAVITILCNLEPREQLIFMFQLLRDGGYQIDHNSFAKVVKLSRSQYMRILNDVRLKSWLYVQGFKNQDKVGLRHKEA